MGLNKKEEDGKEKPVYVASQIEDALVERYATMIVTSHADNCLWRQRGCDGQCSLPCDWKFLLTFCREYIQDTSQPCAEYYPSDSRTL